MSSIGSPSSQAYHSPDTSLVEDQQTSLYTRPRTASTGGGRAWSEEEESYLIETRLHKMPYKHIAAHLQKTELACRLHYHQLSFGTKRRKRNSSTSSVRSACSSTVTHELNLQHQHPLPALSPPNSPENIIATTTLVQSPHNPVPILPKPIARSQHAIHSSNSLHLITQDIERFEERSRINKDRLARIYEAHRTHFWSTIARDYGDNVSPALLEDVWRRDCGRPSSNYPPTPPNRSPRSSQAPSSILGSAFTPLKLGSAFSPINVSRSTVSTPGVPSRSSFAISSLLTEDKEVRSPGERRIEA
ncbi:hypothetical protein MMC26_000302 [Xylographa opegraphella]|nr:hypothetical protein [Xylographa opegraphella]